MKFVEYIGPHYYNDATTLVSVGIVYTNKSNMATIPHLSLYTRAIRLEHVKQMAYFVPKNADSSFINQTNDDCFIEKRLTDNLLKLELRKNRI